MNLAPYTAFGQTLNIPVHVYVDAEYVDNGPQFDETLWIERGEDWYAFSGMKGKRVRVIKGDDWRRASRAAERKIETAQQTSHIRDRLAAEDAARPFAGRLP